MAWKINQATDEDPSTRGRNGEIVFVALSAALLLWQLYKWSQGSATIQRSSGPAAFLLLGLRNLLGRGGPLYYVLSAMSLLLLIEACIDVTVPQIS
jgi:hypothetical protein